MSERDQRNVSHGNRVVRCASRIEKVLTALNPLTVSSATSMLAMARLPPGTIEIHWSARFADSNTFDGTLEVPIGIVAVPGVFLGSLERPAKSRWSQFRLGGTASFIFLVSGMALRRDWGVTNNGRRSV